METAMALTCIRTLFGIAAAYDFLIGLAFLAVGPAIFEAAAVPPPNHWGYIQFAALMLVIFGLMFFAVALAPQRNRNLIPYGILLKVSYTSVVLYYWLTTDLPTLFKPFAIIDAVMLILFLAAYTRLSPAASAQS
jgi:hypothetical protein